MKILCLFLLYIIVTSSSVSLAQGPLRESVMTIKRQTDDREMLEERNAKAHESSNTRAAASIGSYLMNDADMIVGQLRDPFTGIPSNYGRELMRVARLQAIAVSQNYKLHSQATKVLARQRQLGLEDSALGLEEQLANPAAQGQSHLVPQGTNLYVRNYCVTPTQPIIELLATQKRLTLTPYPDHLDIKTKVSGKLLRP